MKTKEEFLTLMCFPKEWLEWDMIPNELANMQLSNYEVGHENACDDTHDCRFTYARWQPAKYAGTGA